MQGASFTSRVRSVLLDARQAIARDYARRGMSVAADRIVLTASTSEAYSVLFKLLADAGDEVLVPRPSYPLFDHLTRLDLVTAKPYDLEYHGSWSIDINSVERAMTSRTRALLLVSPNNPTGSFVDARELDQLAASVRRWRRRNHRRRGLCRLRASNRRRGRRRPRGGLPAVCSRSALAVCPSPSVCRR